MKMLESSDESDNDLFEENKRLLLMDDNITKTMHKLLFCYYQNRLLTFRDKSVELLEENSSLIICKKDLQCKINRLKVFFFEFDTFKKWCKLLFF